MRACSMRVAVVLGMPVGGKGEWVPDVGVWCRSGNERRREGAGPWADGSVPLKGRARAARCGGGCGEKDKADCLLGDRGRRKK